MSSMSPAHGDWPTQLLRRVDAASMLRVASRARIAALVVFVLSLGALGLVAAWPMPDVPTPTAPATPNRPSQRQGSTDTEALLSRLAGRPLMGAPGAKTGLPESAALLQVLGTLRLTGTSVAGAQSVAYVQLPSGQLAAVRAGDRLLQFQVDGIEKSKVHLSADGARYVLSYK